MRFIHLSDLHFGKRWNEYSLLEDQEHIVKRILDITDEEKPAAVVIAGDVYDKTVPSAEAVQLFDSFLFSLAQRKLKVFIISGNHDSPERLSFGGRLMEESGVYISPVYGGSVSPIVLEDGHGSINVYMLPFIKPANVRRFFPDDGIESYTDALHKVITEMNIDTSERNILITHQFVTGAERSESEDISVGGSDNVDVSVFDDFDYVALGHIHRPQKICRDTVRYCGTPLKYSFSEADHSKSVTVVEMGEKGNVEVRTRELKPLRDVRRIVGTFAEVTSKDSYINTDTDDYVSVTLKDEEDIPNAMDVLRVIYPNIMKLEYDNSRTRSNNRLLYSEENEKKSPYELFSDFYEDRNGQRMNEKQSDFVKKLIESIWEGGE